MAPAEEKKPSTAPPDDMPAPSTALPVADEGTPDFKGGLAGPKVVLLVLVLVAAGAAVALSTLGKKSKSHAAPAGEGTGVRAKGEED